MQSVPDKWKKCCRRFDVVCCLSQRTLKTIYTNPKKRLMKIITNSDLTNHGQVLSSLYAQADEIVFVSPFCYPDFSEFAEAVANANSIRRVSFVTTLKNDEVIDKIDSLLSFRYEMERVGLQWNLRLDNKLHGKVYLFKKGGRLFSGIVTSANLTHNGMTANHEYGCLIENADLLSQLETQVMADAVLCDSSKLDRVNKRACAVRSGWPEKNAKTPVVEIDDIIYVSIDEQARVFIKPIGDASSPIYKGNYSKKTNLNFSKKRPASVRIGDIIITYAVGGRKIIGAFKVKSEAHKTSNPQDRWPWYVESENLTPKLSDYKWAEEGISVTGVANKYADDFKIPVTYRGGYNLNALNRGCDKIRLSDDYGRFLLNLIMKREAELV